MKYTITEDRHPEYVAFRIMAAEDCEALNIKSGDLGGFISKKENLSEEGNAWVFGDSAVLGDSVVSGDAIIKDNAVINNVIVGLDSSISNVTISDAVFSNKVRVYGKKNSIVISDKSLKYLSITATKFTEDTDVVIGYSTFLGNIPAFQDFIKTDRVCDEDKELLEKYLEVIMTRF